MSRELFTVGYEGTDIKSFVTHLKSHAINCLIDVRERPQSRKPGFSKSSLSMRLEREGILYLHLKELGSPKLLRDGLKHTGDYGTFFRDMDEYIGRKQGAIETAYAYVTSKTCCLMCFEYLASACHRKIVAKKIKERNGNGLQIKDI